MLTLTPSPRGTFSDPLPSNLTHFAYYPLNEERGCGMELYKSHLADGAVAGHVPLLEITWAQPGIAQFLSLVHWFMQKFTCTLMAITCISNMKQVSKLGQKN